MYKGTLHYGEPTSDQQKDLREEVAVKILEDGADEGDKIKFLQEAAIMGQFNHPNIIRILGITIDEPVRTSMVINMYINVQDQECTLFLIL